MLKSMASFQIAGTLVSEPEYISYGADGSKQLANLTVRHTETWQSSEGPVTKSHEITVKLLDGRQVNALQEAGASAGDVVIVTGAINVETWEDRVSGEPRRKQVLKALSVSHIPAHTPADEPADEPTNVEPEPEPEEEKPARKPTRKPARRRATAGAGAGDDGIPF